MASKNWGRGINWEIWKNGKGVLRMYKFGRMGRVIRMERVLECINRLFPKGDSSEWLQSPGYDLGSGQLSCNGIGSHERWGQETERLEN